jgi:hypothetical protein
VNLTEIKKFSPTSKKTQHFSTTKINLLMLFKEIIPVFIENYERSISMNAALLIAKPSEIYLPMDFKGL